MTVLNKEQISAENARFADMLYKGKDVRDDDGQTGYQKFASITSEDMVFTRLYEDGFLSQIFQKLPITDSELDIDPENISIPTKYVPLEVPLANGYTAQFSDWMGATQDLWYEGALGKIVMYPIVSRQVKLSENQIRRSPIPLRQFLEGVIRNDMLAVQDKRLMNIVNRCISITGNRFTSPNPYWQLSDLGTLAQMFVDKMIPLTTVLMNEHTYLDSLKWTQSQVGSQVMAQLYEEGAYGTQGKYRSYGNYKIVTTLNQDVVPKGKIYGFGPQSMTGKFYDYGVPVTITEYKDPLTMFKMKCAIGMEILNPNACAVIEF